MRISSPILIWTRYLEQTLRMLPIAAMRVRDDERLRRQLEHLQRIGWVRYDPRFDVYRAEIESNAQVRDAMREATNPRPGEPSKT